MEKEEHKNNVDEYEEEFDELNAEIDDNLKKSWGTN